LLEQRTLSDSTVQRTLEPYEHIQLWGDGDPEQKKLAHSLGGAAYPTIVFLNAKGEPVYKSKGYKKPDRFLADCIKASEILGVSIPEEARALSAGVEPSGSVPAKTPPQTKTDTTGEPAHISAQKDPRRNWVRQAAPAAGQNPFNDPSNSMPPAPANSATMSSGTYSPLKAATFAISSGKYDQARSILNNTIAKDSANAEAHYLLAVAYVMSRQYALAADQYRLVIKLQPGSQAANLSRQGLTKLGL
jgi:TolA-binding protein